MVLGAESNHRHCDFQSDSKVFQTNTFHGIQLSNVVVKSSSLCDLA